jgi:outer membrane protein assembly factor BamE (lipoprotein component of BamABCDE complex)
MKAYAGIGWRNTMSAKKESGTDAGTPGSAVDTSPGEKTVIMGDKDLETVIIQPDNTLVGSAADLTPKVPGSMEAEPADALDATKTSVEDEALETVMVRPSALESPAPGSPGTLSPPESKSPGDTGHERTGERLSKTQSEDRTKRKSEAPEKKGAGMKKFLLGIILFLVLGAGALLGLHLVNPNSEVLKLLPFKLSSENPQQAVSPPDTGVPLSTPAVSQKFDQVEAKMTGNAVRRIPGEPVPEATGGQASLPATIPPPAATDIPAQRESLSSVAKDYDRIQVGMSPEAVRQILGVPMETRTLGQLTEWEYDVETGLFQVAFQGGKVAFRGKIPYHITARADQTPPATTIPGSVTPVVTGGQASPSTTSKDYTKVVAGMTSDAVRQILGEPSEVKKLRASIEWEYKTPKGIFEVRFRGDKVVYKGMTPAKVR